jgi:putative ABC transport system permease protein
MTRGQIAGMLAREGALVAALGVAAGTGLGLAIGVVLIRVVNRQSFHWSMDITVPAGGLALFALALVALASAASVLAARRAMGMDALRAVREDW